MITLLSPLTSMAQSPALDSPFKRETPSLDAADIAFKKAHRAQRRDRLIDFEAAAAQVPEDYLLADYIGYWRLRLALRAADAPSASLDRAVRRFIALHADSLTGDLMRRQWMLELASREQWREMLSHMPAWQRRTDSRVLCRAGQARLMLGQAPGEAAMQALQDDRDLGDDCGGFAFALQDRGVLSEQDLRARMWRALEMRDWKSVTLLTTRLGTSASRVRQALRASVRLLKNTEAESSPAMALVTPQKRDALIIALVSHARPKPESAADWMARLGDRLTPAEQGFVWSQIAGSAMRDMIEPAYDYARRAVGSPATDITRRWLARAALRQLDWALLETFVAEMAPATRRESTWMYWRARAMQASGETYGAQALMRHVASHDDFYGTLAAEEQGQFVKVPGKLMVAPDPIAVASISRLPGLVRARQFYDLGLTYQGNREWNLQLRGLNDQQLRFVAHHACQAGLPERCVATAWRTRKEHDWALRYLSPYRAPIESTARRRALDPAWVYGLMQQESRFQLDARSYVGARGLMQIMPTTGRWIARQLGVKNYRRAHLEQFSTNVNFGTFYLQRVYQELDHSMLLASAGYNAGPRRPRRWQASLPGLVDGALFAEIIPYRETRRYVKKVLLNTAYYGAVFEKQPQSLKRLLGNVPDRPFDTVSTP